MAEPRRRARRGDGGRAFQEVLSHARSLLEPIASTQKELRLRSVREAGALLARADLLVDLGNSWRARALSTSNLQRLHSVVAELSDALGLGHAVPPPPPPRLAAGEGGETSEDEDAEAWALAPPRPACATRRRAGDPCSDKPLREVRRQQQAPAALKKRQRAVQHLDTENGGDDAPPPSAAAAASSTKSPVDPSKLPVSELQERLRSELGQHAKLPRRKGELVRLHLQQRRRQGREAVVELGLERDDADPAERPRLRLRQTRGPPLLRPVFPLAHCPARVCLGRQHLALALVGGPAGERPELAPGCDGVLRYGAGHAVRIGRAPCSPGPEGTTMQLRGSAKVSRRACSIAWDEASSRFRVASLGSVGVMVDGTHRKAGTHAPVGDGSTIAFFGNPAWPAGHRPAGAFPADTYVLPACSKRPSGSQQPPTRQTAPPDTHPLARGGPRVPRGLAWPRGCRRGAELDGLPTVRALCPAMARRGGRSVPGPRWPTFPRVVVQVFELRSTGPVPSDGSRWELLSPIVSREHCAIEYDARSGGWNVTDLGSTFGTAVGGRKLSDGEAAPLRPGSELLLGSPLADARALGFVLEPDC